MLFNSLTFCLFFGAVLLLHSLPSPWRTKKVYLLVASYLFYAAWNPPFVVLLWISTLVDWNVAAWMHRAERRGVRRALLAVSVAVNLGILGYFKYGGFLLENFVALMGALGVAWEPAAPDIVLPIGISFYTFQTMAYSLDVYFRRAEPEESLLDFSLFVTFFPQLVAGPIVRPSHLLPQLKTPKKASGRQLSWGLGLMTLGLFEKVVVADTLLAETADEVFAAGEAVAPLDAWLGASAFSGQIFCDFAGYTTIAIGAALCLGFHLPDNFRAPYAAVGLSDFWRRWHVSLSTWLRDYLYIPLGGNRKGPARTHVNLMVTMLLGGLWHGAQWTFVAWGALHGVYLVVERLLRRLFAGARWVAARPTRIVLALVTYALVDVTWVFFRAEDFETAGRLAGSMLFLAPGEARPVPAQGIVQTVGVVGAMLLLHALMRDRRLEAVVEKTPWWLVGLVWGGMAWLIVAAQGSEDAFIYFQF